MENKIVIALNFADLGQRIANKKNQHVVQRRGPRYAVGLSQEARDARDTIRDEALLARSQQPEFQYIAEGWVKFDYIFAVNRVQWGDVDGPAISLLDAFEGILYDNDRTVRLLSGIKLLVPRAKEGLLITITEISAKEMAALQKDFIDRLDKYS